MRNSTLRLRAIGLLIPVGLGIACSSGNDGQRVGTTSEAVTYSGSALVAFQKHGNNGTVNCNTYCEGAQWGATGSCTGSWLKNFPCSMTTGLLPAGEQLSCECSSGGEEFLKPGDNGTSSCNTFCAGSQWGRTGTCVSAFVAGLSEAQDCSIDPGLITNGTEMTCLCATPSEPTVQTEGVISFAGSSASSNAGIAKWQVTSDAVSATQLDINVVGLTSSGATKHVWVIQLDPTRASPLVSFTIDNARTEVWNLSTQAITTANITSSDQAVANLFYQDSQTSLIAQSCGRDMLVAQLNFAGAALSMVSSCNPVAEVLSLGSATVACAGAFLWTAASTAAIGVLQSDGCSLAWWTSQSGGGGGGGGGGGTCSTSSCSTDCHDSCGDVTSCNGYSCSTECGGQAVTGTCSMGGCTATCVVCDPATCLSNACCDNTCCAGCDPANCSFGCCGDSCCTEPACDPDDCGPYGCCGDSCCDGE
jgi:hypothetical protein